MAASSVITIGLAIGILVGVAAVTVFVSRVVGGKSSQRQTRTAIIVVALLIAISTAASGSTTLLIATTTKTVGSEWTELRDAFSNAAGVGLVYLLFLLAHIRKRLGPLGYPPGIWKGAISVERVASRTGRVIRGIGPLRHLAVYLIAPCSTPASVAIAFILVAVPYAYLAVSRWVAGAGPLEMTDSIIVSKLIESGMNAPASEEPIFRWLGLRVGGLPGLFVFSILLWPLTHLYRHEIWFPLFLVPVALFYIKLWRGKFYWLSFAFHSLTNIALIPISLFVVRM